MPDIVPAPSASRRRPGGVGATLGVCPIASDAIAAAMQAQSPAELAHLLAELRVEHRDLDTAIKHLAEAVGCDELQLTRMKKRKLLLKDTIARLESKLIPDLDA